MYIIVKVGSVTNAQRGQRLLRSYGYKASITRIENPNKSEGCGYALKLNAEKDSVVNILLKNGINVRGVQEYDIP